MNPKQITMKSLCHTPRSPSPICRRISIQNARFREKRHMSKDVKAQILMKECHAHLCSQGLLGGKQSSISGFSFCTIKKHTVLDDGCYILVNGKMAYAKAQSTHEVDKKEQLLNSAKTGGFTKLRRDPYDPDPQLKLSYSLEINEPFALLQSHKSNFMSLDDCYLIKLEKEAQEILQYHLLKQERVKLCHKAYLDGQINTEKGLIFTVDTQLHHTFKFQSYPFGAVINLDCLAIIKKGVLRKEMPQVGACQFDTLKNWQIEQYGIVVPGISYFAGSDEVVLMKIDGNPTMCYWNEALTKTRQKMLRKVFKPKSFNYSKSVHVSSQPCLQTNLTKKEQLKMYNRELRQLTRQFDPYITTSMYTCCKENQAVRQQIRKQRMNRQESTKYKAPTVLFDFNKSKNNKIMPSLKRMFEENCFTEPNSKGKLLNRRTPKVKSINCLRSQAIGEADTYPYILNKVGQKKRSGVSQSVYHMGPPQ